MDSNKLQYTRLPKELHYSSVEEIVDCYNSFFKQTKQYRDLVFVENQSVIDTNVKLPPFHFGIFKQLVNDRTVTVEINTIQYLILPTYQNNLGITIFDRLQSGNNFYCEYALFTFK